MREYIRSETLRLNLKNKNRNLINYDIGGRVTSGRNGLMYEKKYLFIKSFGEKKGRGK